MLEVAFWLVIVIHAVFLEKDEKEGERKNWQRLLSGSADLKFTAAGHEQGASDPQPILRPLQGICQIEALVTNSKEDDQADCAVYAELGYKSNYEYEYLGFEYVEKLPVTKGQWHLQELNIAFKFVIECIQK